jgi:SpoVK/Ycf46/Vps4 family AAA+-type ATPase
MIMIIRYKKYNSLKSSLILNIMENIIENEKDLKRKNLEYDVEEQKNKKVKVEENIEINNLNDLINLGENIEVSDRDKYNFDITTLYYLVPSLKKLNEMIGMEKVKDNIVNQIIFHLQGLDNYNEHMMHTVIYGPPGVGKTELGKIMGEIYCDLGVLDFNDYSFHIMKRSDLIGRYLGETAIKTQEAIEKCKGGVMFIDEVYSLGNPEKKDSYSKECIDVLNQNLSENKSSFICIIAGYKESVDKCFFAQNEGLERRFPYRYEIDNYNATELQKIFINLVFKSNWKLENEDCKIEFFEENKEYFKYNGGDLENLFEQVKIAHSRRIFGLSKSNRKCINYKDIIVGFEKFKDNNTKKIKEENKIIPTMYS